MNSEESKFLDSLPKDENGKIDFAAMTAEQKNGYIKYLLNKEIKKQIGQQIYGTPSGERRNFNTQEFYKNSEQYIFEGSEKLNELSRKTQKYKQDNNGRSFAFQILIELSPIILFIIIMSVISLRNDEKTIYKNNKVAVDKYTYTNETALRDKIKQLNVPRIDFQDFSISDSIKTNAKTGVENDWRFVGESHGGKWWYLPSTIDIEKGLFKAWIYALISRDFIASFLEKRGHSYNSKAFENYSHTMALMYFDYGAKQSCEKQVIHYDKNNAVIISASSPIFHLNNVIPNSIEERIMDSVVNYTTNAVIDYLSKNPQEQQKLFEDFYTGKVVSIADGDSFTILTESKTQIKIRLHGVDCPEYLQDYGTKAKQFVSDLVFGKQVEILKTDDDKYGRVVAIVIVDGVCVNEELLKQGFAWHYKQYDQSERYAQLENKARLEKRGLWAKNNPVAPWDFRSGKTAQETKTTQTNTEKTVLICNSKSSYAYHIYQCKGLSRCRSGISKVTVKEAVNRGYQPCEICCK